MLSFFSKKWQKTRDWIKKTTLWTSAWEEQGAPFCCEVLCVDDDPGFCQFIQQLAASLQIKVDTAYSIAAAKQAIDNHLDYRAFIIDGHLPDGSGFELVAWIREKKKLQTPIGFVSRIYQDAKSFRILKEGLGVDYVLEKPIEFIDVHQLLIKLCKISSQSLPEKPFSEDLLADLKINYQKTISDKLERLEKMILKVQKDPTIDYLQTLKGEIHKIAGSAGSYGFMSVSELCKNLELELIKQIDLVKRGGVDRQWIYSLDDFFSQIKIYFQIDVPELETLNDLRSHYLPSIYVVDEDQDFLKLFTLSEYEQHFDILTESRPDDAIRTLLSADFYPQILFLNTCYQTSPLTGYDIVKSFLEQQEVLTTHVALMVNEKDTEEQVKAFQRGVTFVFTKPLSLSFLLPLLDQTPFRALPLHYKILVFDDDLDICQYIQTLLKFSGLEVVFVQNFQDLEKNLKSYKPDLILLDINLTDELGVGILEKIRKELCYQKQVVGMLSITERETSLIQKCYAANVDEMLFKPLEGGELQRKITYLLKKQAKEKLSATNGAPAVLESAQILKRYLQEVRQLFHLPFPKILVIFEVEGFSSLDQKLKEEGLVHISQSLEELFKKYEMAAYLEEGRFTLLFQGYNPYFVQLFMQTFLREIHSRLQNTVMKNSGFSINESLVILSEDEEIEDFILRGTTLLHTIQQSKEPVRLTIEATFTPPKEVRIYHDKTQSLDLIIELFKSHAFEVSLLTNYEEELLQTFVHLPLVILTGSFVEAKGIGLLKKNPVLNQGQTPILYLSHWPSQGDLEDLLRGLNYFETPFGMIIFIAEA